MSNWSCDERKVDYCRNSHGCHCKEINSLVARNADLHRQLAAAREALDVCETAFAEAEELYQNGILHSPEGTSDRVVALRQAARNAIAALSPAPAPSNMQKPHNAAAQKGQSDD